MNLKNKKVLITAGPTCAAIDSVRVIGNTATGETGVLLAEELLGSGAKVTLLSGAAGCCINKRIKLIHFQSLDELSGLLRKELGTGKYDIVIHSAAVCDYKPKKAFDKKIRSGMKEWKITLVPAPKIIDRIKKIDNSVFLVGFKFETGSSKKGLIDKARKLILRSGAGLVVANTADKGGYRAYITDGKKASGPAKNKKAMAAGLIRLLTKI